MTPPDDLPAAGLPRLLAVMACLRDPAGGCPWDRAQDFASIAPYTIEEAYEVADAIARGDLAGLREELGDLLLQVVYHARMAEEAGLFDFAAVARGAADKMVARHPHVFGATPPPADAAAQTALWEARKAAERAGGGALAGVALALPALARAAKLQARAARVGFDWPDAAGVASKLAEEAAELARARAGKDRAEVAEEYGDLLFAMTNLGRHLDLDPEAALRAAGAKFERRFAALEARLARRGRGPGASGADEIEAAWEAVKAAERADPA
ncbi:MAG: nucleoside triphosphate pyrophosphohydrolase [Rhodobacteraceae bacterium]|nr:nucleoside triphosphate pyrophosphohydrolase [Paracoccaceae bacterium]